MQIINHMNDAVREQRAIAAFNAPSFDVMFAIGLAASELNSPVIIQTSARLVKKYGAPHLKAWFETARQTTGANCFLHLDHCHEESLLKDCIHAGWDMVMFDGSHFPISENVKRIRDIVALAHAHGVAVEGEVGSIGGEEDGYEAEANYARDADIAALAATGIDCIAIGFGNVHGDYESKSHLRWDIYEKGRAVSNLPLVLHGGSGLTEEEFFRAIRAGTAKINISTELKKVYAKIVSRNDILDIASKNPSAIHEEIIKGCQDVSRHYINLFCETSKA